MHGILLHWVRSAALAAAGIAACVPAVADAQETDSGQANVQAAKEEETQRFVPAKLKRGNKIKEVFLIERKGDEIVYRFDKEQDVTATLKIAEIQAAKFDLDFDESAYYEALADAAWIDAATILFEAVVPAMPFIDLPHNNIAPLALEAAGRIMRGAAGKRGGVAVKPENNAAKKEYRAAYNILRGLHEATWFEDVDEVRFRSVLCLVMQGRIGEAEEAFEKWPEPVMGETAYAYYSLAKAHLALQEDEYRKAMDAVVQSLVFETKDLDTFPESLLLSALCYEKLGEWHRARDVYFEVARLFQQYHWADHGVERLRYIMDEGLTAEEEDADLRKIFFGVNENMNEKVSSFLASRDGEGEQEETEDPDKQAKDKK